MQLLDIAEGALSTFARTTQSFSPGQIRNIENNIRTSFKDAGYDIDKDSAVAAKIKAAVYRAHYLSLKAKMRILSQAGTDGAFDYEYVANIYDELRDHRQNVELTAEKRAMLNVLLENSKGKAHRTCAENIIWRFDNSFVPIQKEIIHDKVIQICLHFEALNEPIEVGTDKYNRIWDAVYRACERLHLNEKHTDAVFIKIEQWFKDRDQNRHIAIAVEAVGAAEIEPPPGYQSYLTRKAMTERVKKEAAAPAIAELERMRALPYKPSKSHKYARVIARNEHLQEWRRKAQEELKNLKL